MFWQDLRFAARMLVKTRGLSAAAVLALALGIGANTAIFSLVDGVLLRPLPFPDADRLFSVAMRFAPQNMDRGPMSMADLIDWRAGNRAFAETAVYQNGRLDLTGTEAAETLRGVFVSSSFFSVLGAHPLHGRLLLPEDETPNGSRLLILSERMWRSRFHGDPAAIGSVVTANGLPYTIVGVMPATFTFPSSQIDFWSNFWMTPPTRRGPFFLWTVARLKPGATQTQAQADADRVAAGIQRAASSEYSNLSMPVVPLRDVLVRDARPALLVMFAAVTCVLLIATVNVANLLLARATSRGREIAVRLSLGASRGRILRQLLTESVLLALIGGVIGVALAYVGLDLLRTTNASSIPRLEDVRLDARVLLFTTIVSIATGVLFGLAPALQSIRANLTGALRDGDRSTTSSTHRRLHAALVIGEIALSLMLLIGAGLLLRSFFLLQRVEAGFQASPAHILTMAISVPRTRFLGQDNRVDRNLAMPYYDRFFARLRDVRGVEAVALSEALPPNRFEWSDSFVIEGQSDADAPKNPSVVIPTVTPEYFRALRVPLLKGRVFDERDTADAPPVTVISAEMARRYFAGRDPIGTRIKLSGPGLPNNPKLTVIGIVGNVTYTGLADTPQPVYYRPFAQAPMLRGFITVRSSAGADLLPTLRRAILAFDRDIVITEVRTMEEALAESIAGPRFRMVLLALFAGVALVLAVTGIYGVMAYAVAQRTHELGLRLALGAARADVLRLVLGQTVWLAIAGIAVGIVGARLLTRGMSTLLFAIEPTDPITFVAMSAMLVAVAVIASLVPARRAMRIDPMVALRHE
jgi:putative ABC transport system permease protein